MILAAAIINAAAAMQPARAEEIVALSGIFVLIDESGTWLSKKNESQNERVLGEVNKAVLDLVSKVETPAAIYIIAIEANSVVSEPVCQATYRRKLINIGGSENVFVRSSDLANYLELCSKAMLNRTVSNWTDIHGSLDMVSKLAATSTFNNRFLFVASDFKEERPPGPLPKINLHDFKVAMVYRILPPDSLHPDEFEKRLDHWKSVFKQAGAKEPVMAIDKGDFAGSTVRKLLAN